MTSGSPAPDRRLPAGFLLVAALVIAFVVAPRIGQGGLAGADGASVTVGSSAVASPNASPSEVPASEAPTPTAAARLSGNGDCGRISAAACAKAIALARKGHETEVAEATRIVVDDTCPPNLGPAPSGLVTATLCDRKYPFDAMVVFVTGGADTTGWYFAEVVGLKDDQPTKVLTWQGRAGVPDHIVQQLRAPQPSP
jgi:hypothetical protein